MYRDIIRAEDPQVKAVIQEITSAKPDVIALQRFDWDQKSLAAAAFQDALKDAGWPMKYAMAPRPNSGLQSGFDLNTDGQVGRATDAQGYGRFAGNRGLLLLSRHPFAEDELVDHSGTLWADVPNNRSNDAKPLAEIQRLSSVAHVQVPIQVGDTKLTLMTFHATPPVFDGPEDRNGRRNADEILFWTHQFTTTAPPFVLLGNANLDPVDGEGIKTAIQTLLNNPNITDPSPKSTGGKAAANPDQQGDPALDTVNWPGDGPGNLRVSYILPSRDLKIQRSGVAWNVGQENTASRHRLVWVDVTLP